MKNITIIGAGAVGCTIAHELNRDTNRNNITLVGRGTHLQHLKEHGILINNKGKEHITRINCVETNDLNKMQDQDIILITTKSYDIPEAVKDIKSIYNNDTVVIPLANGLPWWFLLDLKNSLNSSDITNLGDLGSFQLENSVDKNLISQDRIIGGVIYTGASITSPGHIVNKAGPKIIIGEINNTHSKRVTEISDIFSSANLNHKISNNIRGEILNKLCWNIAFNTLSVIHNLNSKEMVDNASVLNKAKNIMHEMKSLANSLNIDMKLDIEKHVTIASSAGSHKPSMLQDYENEKKLETYAIVGSVIDIANKLNLDLPNINSMHQELIQKIN